MGVFRIHVRRSWAYSRSVTISVANSVTQSVFSECKVKKASLVRILLYAASIHFSCWCLQVHRTILVYIFRNVRLLLCLQVKLDSYLQSLSSTRRNDRSLPDYVATARTRTVTWHAPRRGSERGVGGGGGLFCESSGVDTGSFHIQPSPMRDWSYWYYTYPNQVQRVTDRQNDEV